MATLMLFLGAWLSGYFIIATNAWMQHPVAYSLAQDGHVFVNSLTGLLTNPWIFWQYTHTMTASVVTASCVMAAVGALYLLLGLYVAHAKTFVQTGVIAGAVACALMIFPTGDGNAKQVFAHQPLKGAAFEGLFKTERGAGLILVGQPNMETLTIDNPLVIPKMLSFLIYEELQAVLKGLDAFPRNQWPDNIPLLYYAYHIMAGLGTILASVMGLSLLMLWRGRLSWYPTTMIGGMVSSTILTLLVIPVLYALWRGWSMFSGAPPLLTGTDRALQNSANHAEEGDETLAETRKN
jgi:cytochrome d ubiquinol oxidase subunit I